MPVKIRFCRFKPVELQISFIQGNILHIFRGVLHTFRANLAAFEGILKGEDLASKNLLKNGCQWSDFFLENAVFF